MNKIAWGAALLAGLAACEDKDTTNPSSDPADPSGPVADACDDADNDGDGSIDEDDPPQTWFYDLDGDGYGQDGATTTACELPTGFAAAGGDCDDADAAVNPAAAEQCDGLDDDCDALVDEDFAGDSDGDGRLDCRDFEACDGADNDGDGAIDEGFGDNDADGTANCVDSEECDGLDNDGDGEIDDGMAGITRFYPDQDGDGYGEAGAGIYACAAPPGTADNDEDCDDDDPAITPLLETCTCDDGLDNDSDGLVDCEDGECAADSACQEDCSDGSDNDLDGLADCDDDECWGDLAACRETLAWVNGGYFRGGTQRTLLDAFDHGTGTGSFPWNSAWSVSGSIRVQSPYEGTHSCAWTLDSVYWADMRFDDREIRGGVFESWEVETYVTPPDRRGLQLSPDCPIALDLEKYLPSYVGAGAAMGWGAAVFLSDYWGVWGRYEVPGVSRWYSAASWNSTFTGSSFEEGSEEGHGSAVTRYFYTWTGTLAPGDEYYPFTGW